MSSKSPKYIIFVGVFVFKGAKLLLAKRSESEGHLPGCWAVPGGKVEPIFNEWDVLQATARREITEETGVVVAKSMHMFSNNTFIRSDGSLTIAVNFLCQHDSGKAKPLDGTSDVKWFARHELDSLKLEANIRKQIDVAFDCKETLLGL